MNLTAYLAHSKYIDWQDPDIQKQAKGLRGFSDEQTARNCFLFVRDTIKHSWDYKQNPVTIRASDVLKHQTGFCYAKSHLLAALLRANSIAAGLCYQRLTLENDQAPFCLHGLNAIHLKEYGWYRVDARGNKEGVDAQFCPPIEQLAFSLHTDGEFDFHAILAEPLDLITHTLSQHTDIESLIKNLPDSDSI